MSLVRYSGRRECRWDDFHKGLIDKKEAQTLCEENRSQNMRNIRTFYQDAIKRADQRIKENEERIAKVGKRSTLRGWIERLKEKKEKADRCWFEDLHREWEIFDSHKHLWS